MFSVVKERKNGNLAHEVEKDGFVIGANRSYNIDGSEIGGINVLDRSLASSIVTKKVMSKYSRLIEYLTELLVSDDDTGDAMREALNQIEKFRLEIKIKYRKYLKRKELELMSKQLVQLQKAANKRLLEIHNSYLEQMENKRSR